MVALLGTASAVLIGTAFRNRDSVDGVAIHTEETARDLRTVFAQPISRAALANNVIGGSVMMFVMTAAPIAAVANHHTIDDGAGIIQWHLVGMYAPSLFAGRLIDRFGMPIVLFSGMALSAACALVALGSTSLWAFYVSLLCLGSDGTSCTSAARHCSPRRTGHTSARGCRVWRTLPAMDARRSRRWLPAPCSRPSGGAS
jgi:hypothetical protein